MVVQAAAAVLDLAMEMVALVLKVVQAVFMAQVALVEVLLLLAQLH
jgi:hypothetical protein